ncbi:MAG: sugar phosphate nucleotidyltransferase [Pseudomonadota bacterium]
MNYATAIILAAGKGTRMKSEQAKVLHLIAGVPMIDYVVEAVKRAGLAPVIVVVGYQAEAVRAHLVKYPYLCFALQEEQLGTGHAVKSAVHLIPPDNRDVVILCGDTPILRPKTLSALVSRHRSGSSPVTMLVARVDNPSGYGRIITSRDQYVMRIVEEPDATEEEKKINLINAGIYCVNSSLLQELLGDIRPANAQKELYLTDIVGIAADRGTSAVYMEVEDSEEVLGVNTMADLAHAEKIMAL